MTENNSAAAAARENARTSTGQFGTQPRSEADVDLGADTSPESWAQASVTDLAAYRDDHGVRNNPDAAPALKRVAILAAAFRDRPDNPGIQNAVNETVAAHDVPGGLLEGFRADNGNSHVGFLQQVGHRGRVLAVKQPWDSSPGAPVAEEKHAVLAALTEEKLRGTEQEVYTVPAVEIEQIRATALMTGDELDEAEMAEVGYRLGNLYGGLEQPATASETMVVVDQVREASRGMSLTQLRENHFGAHDAASVAAEALGENAQKTTQFQRTEAGDLTGNIIFATPAGKTVEYTGGYVRHDGKAHWHESSARATRLRELPQIIARIDRGED